MKLEELDLNKPIAKENGFKGRHEKLMLSNGYRNALQAAINLQTQINSIPTTKDNEWENKYMLKHTEDLISLLEINLDTAVNHVRRCKTSQ